MKYQPKITLTSLLQSYIQNAFSSNSFIKIGSIQSFDKTDQTATIKIMDKKPIYSLPTEPQKIEDYPVLEKVPCHFLRFGQGYVAAPPVQGDYCILLFCDHTLDYWWSTGGGQPNYTKKQHDLSDAIAIVGLGNSINPINAMANALVLCFNPNNSITIQNGQIAEKSPVINQTASTSMTITTPTLNVNGSLIVSTRLS